MRNNKTATLIPCIGNNGNVTKHSEKVRKNVTKIDKKHGKK